jgi:hypothetical protein
VALLQAIARHTMSSSQNTEGSVKDRRCMKAVWVKVSCNVEHGEREDNEMEK